MRLLSQAPTRYVLLVLDDQAESVSTRLRRAVDGAELVAFTSTEAAASAVASGRRYSAVVADRFDQHLAELAARAGIPAIAAGPTTTPEQLAAAISDVADPVPRANCLLQLGPTAGWESAGDDPRADGRLVAVCGPGGTGATSIAAAIAAAFAPGRRVNCGPGGTWTTSATASGAPGGAPTRESDRGPSAANPISVAVPRSSGSALGRPSGRGRPMPLLLADFALRADQAFLHGADEAPTGLLDLVEAGRYRPLSAVDARRHTFALGSRRLLPGLRRPEHWTAVSPPAFDAMLTGLLRFFGLVVADITGEFEGELETGSLDVEERNHMARATARAADVVVAVGGPSAHGARRLAQVVDGLFELGVDPVRIQPVINRMVEPTSTGRTQPRICGLPAPPIGVSYVGDTVGEPRPVHPAAACVGDDTAPAPAPDGAGMVARAVADLLARIGAPDRRPVPIRVIPGSLGCAAP